MYQTVEYAKTLENKNIIYLGMYREEKMCAATFLYITKKKGLKHAYAPRGFLIDYTDFELVTQFTELVKSYLKNNRIISLKLNPLIIKSIYNYHTEQEIVNDNFDDIFNHLTKLHYKHKGFKDNFETLFPRFEVYVDINLEFVKIFSQFNKSLKTKLRGADLRGIRIHKGNISDLDSLYIMSKYKYKKDIKYFKKMMLEFKNKSEIYYAKLDTTTYLRYIQLKYQNQIQICAKYNEEVFKKAGKANNSTINKKIEAEKILTKIKKELIYATNLLKKNPDGILLASCLIIKHKNEIYLCMDGYDTKYKNFNAKHLLIWKIIESYSHNNFERFYLGGVSNSSNSKYTGLNKFKLSFCSKRIEYIGNLELTINNFLNLLDRILNIFDKKEDI